MLMVRKNYFIPMVALTLVGCQSKLQVNVAAGSQKATVASTPDPTLPSDQTSTVGSKVPAPGAFSIISPYQDTLSWESLPTLTWTASPNATAYSVIVANDSECSSIVVQSSNQAPASYVVDQALSYGQTYYICVTASNSTGNLSASNNGFRMVIGFTSDIRIAAPTLSYTTAMSFGAAVALSEDGSTLVVGALADPYDGDGINYLVNAGAAYVYINQSGNWVQQQKLVPQGINARNANESWAPQVAISGDTIVVSNHKHVYDDNGGNALTDAGAAWVFTRTAGVWTQQQKLVGTGTNGRNTSDYFGYAIAISGDTIAVGTRNSYDSAGANLIAGAGSVFVFTRSGTTWSLQDRLVGQGTNGRLANDGFGTSVALYNDTLVAGAPGQDYDESGNTLVSGAGAAFVFLRTAGVWSLQQKIVASGTNGRLANDGFGSTSAIDTDTVAVGTPNQSYDAAGNTIATGAGAVFIFLRTTGTWALEQKIVGTGTNGRLVADYFGATISLSGNTVAIGAYGQDYDASGNNSVSGAGACFVWTRSGATWSFEQKLVGFGTNGRGSSSAFGGYVNAGLAVNGNRIVAGARFHQFDAVGAPAPLYSGAAFSMTRSGSVWSSGQVLVPSRTSPPPSSMGSAIALSADESTLVVGAPQDPYDENGTNYYKYQGAAYVYVKQGQSWTLQQKLVATGTNARNGFSFFGSSVAISGDTIVIGASGHPWDAAGANSILSAGAAFVYRKTGTIWNLEQQLVATGTNARNMNDTFGNAVAIDGDTIAVGSYQHKYDAAGANPVSDSGAVFVYTRSVTTWTLQQKLVATGTNARTSTSGLGMRVALVGDTLVAGAPYNSYDENGDNMLSYAGVAFVYTRASGVWTQQQRLVSSGVNGRVTNGYFGTSIGLTATTLVIGAQGDTSDQNGDNILSAAGAVYIFTKSGSTWVNQQKIVASGVNARVTSDSFGRSVALTGDTLIIGSQNNFASDGSASAIAGGGTAWTFVRSGSAWTQTQRIVGFGTIPHHPNSNFSSSVAVGPTTAAIGASNYAYDSNGIGPIEPSGQVFLFKP